MRFLARVLPLLLATGCISTTYRKLTYPQPNPDDPTHAIGPDLDMASAASSLRLIVGEHQRPGEVAACWEGVATEVSGAGDSALWDAMWRYGSCYSDEIGLGEGPPAGDAGTNRDLVITCLDPLYDLVTKWPESCTERGLSVASDRVRVAYDMARVAESVVLEDRLGSGFTSLRADTFSQRVCPVVPPGPLARQQCLRAGVVRAAHATSLVLSADVRVGNHEPARSLPVLALSGGAANGAFTAGYLYALLSMRDAALRLPVQGESDAQRTVRIARYERDYRLAGAVSTSVGSVAALPVDIYFTDEPDARRQALELLRDRFVADEWELLCANRGLVVGLLSGHTKGLLMFDPFMHNVLAVDLDGHEQAMLDNDFLRIATSVEVERNLTVGLDERLCRRFPDDTKSRDDCMYSSILASITEPVLANPVCYAYTGLQGEAPHEGTWLDGGLRTGTPISWAEMVSDGPVLAINTSRLDGVASSGFTNAGQLLFRTVETFTEQTRLWEVAYATLSRGERQWGREATCTWLVEQGLLEVTQADCGTDPPAALAGIREQSGERVVLSRMQAMPGFAGRVRFAAPRRLRPPEVQAPTPALMSPVIARAAPDHTAGGGVLSVFVPDEVPPALAMSGYTFDPESTGQLWVWGALTFLRTHDVVLRHLGWMEMAHCEEWPELSGWVSGEVARYEQELTDLEDVWRKSMEDPDAYMRRKRRELRRYLPSCEPASGREACTTPANAAEH